MTDNAHSGRPEQTPPQEQDPAGRQRGQSTQGGSAAHAGSNNAPQGPPPGHAHHGADPSHTQPNQPATGPAPNAQQQQAVLTAARAAEQAANTAQQTAQQVSVLVQQVSTLVQQVSYERQHASSTGGGEPAGSTSHVSQGDEPAPPASQPQGQSTAPGAYRLERPPQPDTQPQVQQPSSAQAVDAPNVPSVDIYDGPDELIVFCDLPGIRVEDIRLEGDARRLRIAAERHPTETETDRAAVRQERTRRVDRTIELPTEVRVQEAEATCENGVCRVRLPKTAQHAIGVQ